MITNHLVYKGELIGDIVTVQGRKGQKWWAMEEMLAENSGKGGEKEDKDVEITEEKRMSDCSYYHTSL